MLVKFLVENYLSFQNQIIANFEAGTIKELKENTFYPSLSSQKPLLKCAGVFGKNSSGKSNLIKAMSFMQEFVLNSSKESNSTKLIDTHPFRLSTKTENKPSTFEVIFFIDGKKYRYGFSVTEKNIESEWLFYTLKNKEEKIFIRGKQDFSFEKYFKGDARSKLDLLTQITRNNSLFISVLSQFNNPIGAKVVEWFSNLLIAQDSAHFNLIEFTASLMSIGDYKSRINDIIKGSDLGIITIEEKLKETALKTNYSFDFLKSMVSYDETNYQIRTRHLKYNEKNMAVGETVFDLLQNESLGTQKFFGILGPILFALKERKILWIDEMDARMHSLLFESVIKLFNSSKYNPNGAQLIFTSHNPYILKKGLRRDQMFLVEKDSYGISSISSLYEKRPKTRNDASFDKDYLLGKYGAIPQIQSQLDLFEGI